MGTEFQFEDGKVLEVDDGDGCTTLQINLTPLNCTIKKAKMINLMLCMFYYNKK